MGHRKKMCYLKIYIFSSVCTICQALNVKFFSCCGGNWKRRPCVSGLIAPHFDVTCLADGQIVGVSRIMAECGSTCNISAAFSLLSRVANRDPCRPTAFPDAAHSSFFFTSHESCKKNKKKNKLRCGFRSDVFAGCSPQLEVNLRDIITGTCTHTRCV